MLSPIANRHIAGVLPARWGSTRFPGKPLHLIAGKPLIQHVWERCRAATRLDSLTVATDDARIADAVVAFDGIAVMTSPDHPSGTDRIAETLRSIPQATHVLNIQGDEPLVDPALIDRLAAAITADDAPDMATAANPIDPDDPSVSNPDVVKVVTNLRGDALYFSRSPLPFFRHRIAGTQVLRHKGIYAYSRKFIERFVEWPPSPLEQAESLEQLRALEHGASIRVILTDDASPGVDTPEQALAVEALISQSSHRPSNS